MDDVIDLKTEREPVTKSLTIPVSENCYNRYRKLLNELSNRRTKTLHQFARERLIKLMDEVEDALKKSS